MNPGKLDKKILFEKSSLQRDGTGQQVQNWNQRLASWARVQEMRGPEAQEETMRAATKRILVTIRYREDIDETWRIIYKDRPYDITNVREEIIGPREFYQVIEAQSVSKQEVG